MASYWFENKRFYSVVLSAVNQPNVETIAELESLLKIYRIHFLNLFKHSPKNLLERQKVQSASLTSGIKFEQREKAVVVPQPYVDEALILSDLFDLNEILALQLVFAAQQETAEFPDFTRGFCAIYLYYKNQWYLSEALKTLMFNRTGLTWQYDEHPEELRNLLTSFTEQIWKDGFLTNVLELITMMDVTKQLDKMLPANVKGLGNAKHKKLVTDAIVGSYVSVAQALFYWICQTPLSVDEFSALMRIVRNLEFSKIDQAPAVGAVNLAIVMSAMQSIDVSLLENVSSELGLLSSIPFVKDVRLLNAYHQEISSPTVRWVDPHLEGFFNMVWSVTLRILGQHHLTQTVMDNFSEDEEDLLDRSLDTKPFHWIRQRFLRSENFFDEEFYCRRMNSFVTQLIVNYPIKIKEWRARADEECRSIREFSSTGGETPPIHFEQFLYLIGDFYKNEKLNLNISTQFFCPTDYSNSISSHKLSQTQVSLFKFVRESGEALPPLLYVAYLHMLGGLCADEESSGRCFAMIKGFANYGSHLSSVSLDHFFAALGQYYRTLRAERSSTVHASMGLSCHIAPDELKGLQSWLDLISVIAYRNDRARITFCDDSRWSCLTTLFGLLGCPVPLELKGKMFTFLASVARSAELAQILFEGLIASAIVSVTPDGKLGGLQQELDEVESRNELYPATTGFLEFISSLMSHGRSASFDGVAFRPYFNFVVDSVLVQFQNRSYKNSGDLWNLGCAVGKCLYRMLDSFDVTLTSVNNQTPGCQLMALMICDSPVFRTIVGLIDTGVTVLDQYVIFPGKEKLDEATLFLLKLIFVVLEKQELFISYLREAPTSVLTSSIDVLLQTMNPRTREPDYLTKIACYLSFYDSLPEHCLYTVKILSDLHKNSIPLRTNLLKYFCIKQAVAVRILNGFANCLSMDEVDAPIVGLDNFSSETHQTNESIRASTALTLLEFLIESIRSNVGQPNVAHFLLGFDLKKPSETIFQNPGISDTPKTCLHAVLTILESFCGSNLRSLTHGAFVEPAFRLLVWLASQKLSAEPTLRYLRSQRDFVYRHASKFRLENDDSDVDIIRQEILGWLMKLTALELQSSTQLNHRSNINRFLKFFYSDGSNLDNENDTTTNEDLSKSSIFGISSVKHGSSSKYDKRQILSFLHYLKCKSLSETTAPKLKYFNGSQLSQVISACTVQTSKGYSQCNIVQLHEVLHSEARSIQGTSFSGQLHLLHEEIETVLLSVVQYNEAQRLSYVRRHTFDGWRQLVEISFLSCSMDIFSIEQKVQMTAEILVDTLTFDFPSLNRSVASLLLTLTASLRQQFVSTLAAYDVDATVRDHLSDFETSRYISVLDGTYVRGANVERIEELKHLAVVSSAFRLLLEFMVKPENKRSSQTRALCYGSLMNFIRLTMKPVDYQEQITTSVQYPSVRERMVEEHRKILSEYIVEIVELLTKDSFDGPEVSRILARSCLCTVLSHNPDQDNDIISIMASRGYTEYQIATLITENDPMLEKFLLGQNIVEDRPNLSSTQYRC